MRRRLLTVLATLFGSVLLSQHAAFALTPSPDEAVRDIRTDYNQDCFPKKAAGQTKATYCKYGERGSDVRIAVIGDSKTKQYVTALDYAGTTRGWAVDVYSKTACPFGKYDAGDGGKDYADCRTWNKNVLKRVQSMDYDYVVTGLYYMTVRKTSKYNTFAKRHARFISGVRAQIKDIQSGGGPKVIILNAGPIFSREIPACIKKNLSKPSACNEKKSKALHPEKWWNSTSRKKLMKDLVPTARFISLTGNICPNDTCRVVIGDKIVFRDKHHFTDTYVKNRQGFVARKLEAIIG